MEARRENRKRGLLDLENSVFAFTATECEGKKRQKESFCGGKAQ